LPSSSVSSAPSQNTNTNVSVNAPLVVNVNTAAVLPSLPSLPSLPLLSGLVGDCTVAGSYKLIEGIDYVFGSSMLFVREAKHLFDLEYLRQLGLGYQQTIVARLWRSHSQ
jgi:hypothetical protein